MIRKFAMVLAVVLLGLGVPVASAGARPAPGPSCGPDNPDGIPGEIDHSVRLRQNLPCGITVDGTRTMPVTIDLGGHTAGGVLVEGGSVILKNGTINGDVGSFSGGTVILGRVHLNGSFDYEHNTFGYGIEVRNSTVTGSIAMYQGGVVDHSVIGGGILVSDEYEGDPITITNDVVDNSGIVISASFGHPDVFGLIEKNVITNSPAAGISIGNTHSVSVLTVRKNLVSGNAGDGIYIENHACFEHDSCFNGPHDNPGPVVLRGNQVLDNGGHGINVDSTPPETPGLVVDGGNNHASGNLTDPQCTVVVCKP